MSQKLILVLGATGAQGLGIINALLSPTSDGKPSPYSVRALTRNPSGARAQELAKKGCEVVQGSFDNFETVRSALEGCYGAWINTDGFTVGEQKEIYVGMRIFEIAKQTRSLRHYVWSNLDYAFKKGNYEEKYHCDHYDGKGRVADWLKAQPSDTSETGLTWSAVSSGVYMQMLHNPLFGPVHKRADGTFVFASPVGQGHVTMIALEDLGWWARYVFDHRVDTSAKDLEVASDIVDWNYLVSTFKAVTGQKAVFLPLSIDEWMNLFDGTDKPVANERTFGDGSTTWKDDFVAFWALWRDDVIKRDMDWIRSVHPGSYKLDRWMREQKYTGERQLMLKNVEDGKAVSPKLDVISQL
ncbi:NAD(P)-binding protein [Irpex rosettiformis]|uniref:NAD(P)-binding protein n=1 Tax=Irpex rosettiformis TaxID=378272 RepID=A0ACB8TU52_9APHY|nr:NAD(P)-binding protein [Irpex rosettiformis]